MINIKKEKQRKTLKYENPQRVGQHNLKEVEIKVRIKTKVKMLTHLRNKLCCWLEIKMIKLRKYFNKLKKLKRKNNFKKIKKTI